MILYQSKDFILVTIPPASSLSIWRAGRTHPPTPSLTRLPLRYMCGGQAKRRGDFVRFTKSLSPQAGCSTF
ncbi:MAG: hypothetical protein KJ666_05325 [Bacteroidetes bacterium]|nr:hypothetical protein [Bacteroidota bacterium]MBU2583700.1 hypothetical protein [Bacteroidota bacterium]